MTDLESRLADARARSDREIDIESPAAAEATT